MAARPHPPHPEPAKPEAQRAFGQRLKTLRRAGGLSQEELAERIAMSKDAVSSLERGVSFASFDTLLKIARELERPLDELFAIEGTRSPSIARIVELLRTQPEAVQVAAARQVEVLVELAAGEPPSPRPLSGRPRGRSR